MQKYPRENTKNDWFTLIAISAMVTSLTVGLHEGTHALICFLLGGQLHAYSALYVSCDCPLLWHTKVVSGSASVLNILLGILAWVLLRRFKEKSNETQYFLWLYMLTNLVNGTGYWAFSGVANAGDWATVISGWPPHWLWRVIMTIVGLGTFMLCVRLALHEWGKRVGGQPDELYRRSWKMTLTSYFTGVLVIFCAGLLNPNGVTSFPVIAGLIAVIGATSPLLWMMDWFRNPKFEKVNKAPLVIHRNLHWIVSGLIITGLYLFLLGPTLYF